MAFGVFASTNVYIPIYNMCIYAYIHIYIYTYTRTGVNNRASFWGVAPLGVFVVHSHWLTPGNMDCLAWTPLTSGAASGFAIVHSGVSDPSMRCVCPYRLLQRRETAHTIRAPAAVPGTVSLSSCLSRGSSSVVLHCFLPAGRLRFWLPCVGNAVS